MDAKRAMKQFRKAQFAYHIILASKARIQYIQTILDLNIIYMCECSQKGKHDHVHYLVTCNIGQAALTKRFQRACAKEDDCKNNYCIKIQCEKHFANCIHYLHCSSGQFGHEHKLSNGTLNENYIHHKRSIGNGHYSCDVKKQLILEHIGEIRHSPDCPCVKTYANFIKKVARRRQTGQKQPNTFPKKRVAEKKSILNTSEMGLMLECSSDEEIFELDEDFM